MRLPETISVHASTGRPAGFGELLIADFCDATRAYARLSHMKEPVFVAGDAVADAYVAALSLDELIELAGNVSGSVSGPTSSSTLDSKNKSTALEGLRAEKPAVGSDAKSESFPPTREPSTETRAVAEGIIQPGQQDEPMPAYFIIYATGDELNGNLNEQKANKTTPSRVLDCAYTTLESICSKGDRKLCGVLFIGHAALLATKFTGPRMGFWRRRTSEGMDRLIAATRTGMSVAAYEQLARIDGPKAGKQAKISSGHKDRSASKHATIGANRDGERASARFSHEVLNVPTPNAAINGSIIDVTDPLPFGLAKLLSRTVAR